MADLIRRARILRMDRRAVTALEYGIIASALAFILMAVFAKMGTSIGTAIYGVGNSL